MRARNYGAKIGVWARREEVVEKIRAEDSLADAVSTSLTEIVSGADLVVCAMPVDVMAGCLAKIDCFSKGALVTDVGSVKSPVVREMVPLVEERGGRFLGGHPMAGSEQAGWEYADPELFSGAAVILTPDESTDSGDLSRLTEFWECMGACVSAVSPEDHDRIVAGISHLPHLVAAALVRRVLGEDVAIGSFSGGGFRDTTRVAMGPAEMWSGILASNAEAVSVRLDGLIRELEIWKQALDGLDREGLQRFLSEACLLRESL